MSEFENDTNKLVERAVLLGKQFEGDGNDDMAHNLYRRAVTLNPSNVTAVSHLCAILYRYRRFETVENIISRALNKNPKDPYLNLSMGNILVTLNKHDQSVSYFEKAIEFDNKNQKAYLNIIASLAKIGNFHDGEYWSSKALELFPDDVAIINNLAYMKRQLGDSKIALELQKKAVLLDHKNHINYSNYLFYLLNDESSAPDCYLFEAKKFGELFSRGIKKFENWNKRDDNKIRLGFVSSDLCNHSVSFYFDPWITEVGKAEDITTVAFNNGASSDFKTSYYKSIFDEWNDIFDLDDKALAEFIYNNQIDILIDLSGHTRGNRLPVFCYKPAPIQITTIGYPGSTGVQEIDYIIVQKDSSPESFESHYTEKPFYLQSYSASVNYEASISNRKISGPIVFGSFNSVSKLNDKVTSVWASILNSVPDSVLYLKSVGLDDLTLVHKITENFKRKGLDSTRLIFESASPLEEYFECFNKVDIALDPFPYPSGTLAFHNLWMGVPFVTLRGDRLSRNGSVGKLKTVGLEELIANTKDEYIAIATSLATNSVLLNKIRDKLRNDIRNSVIFDPKRNGLEFVSAIRKIYEIESENY